jgi:hypothetical protein
MRALLLAIVAAGCGPPNPDCALRGNFQRSYRIDTFQLPVARIDFAHDLNGDKKRDNQLGNIIGFLNQASIPAQQQVDTALAEGRFKPMLVVTATDPALRSARGVSVVIGGGGKPGTLCGELRDESYQSDDGASEQRPIEFSLTLPFFDDALVPITAGHVEFQVEGSRLTQARIHGALRRITMTEIVIPAVTRMLNRQVQNAPDELLSGQILSLFDNGGEDQDCMRACRNPDGTCAHSRNNQVEQCEVSTNSLVRNIQAPDVDLFDENDQYQPNPDNTGRDSLSMGIGFTAVEVQ